MCDFINMITAVDDLSDQQDAAGAKRTTEAFLRAISGERAPAHAGAEYLKVYRMVSQ